MSNRGGFGGGSGGRYRGGKGDRGGRGGNQGDWHGDGGGGDRGVRDGRGGYPDRGRGRGSFSQRNRGGRGGAAGPSGAPGGLCSYYLNQGKCTRGAACGFAHSVKMDYSFTSATRNPIRAVAAASSRGLVMFSDGTALHFVHWDNATSAWRYMNFAQQAGEIDALHVVETAEGSAMLFVAFSAAVPVEVDRANYTDVPVGMLKMYDLANLDAAGHPREHFPLEAGCLVAHKQAIVAVDSHVIGGTPSRFLVATGSLDGSIKMWMPEFLPNAGPAPRWQSALLSSPMGHVRAVTCLAFVGDGDRMRLYSGSEDRTVKVWNTANVVAAPMKTLHPPFATQAGVMAHAAPAGGIGRLARPAQAQSADFTVTCIDALEIRSTAVILVGYASGHVRAWSLANPDDAQPIAMPELTLDPDGKSKLTSLAVQMLENMPNAPAVLTGYDDGRIVARDPNYPGLSNAVFSLTNMSIPGGSIGHSDQVLDLLPTAGNFFISGGKDGQLLIWQLALEDGDGSVPLGAPGPVGVGIFDGGGGAVAGYYPPTPTKIFG